MNLDTLKDSIKDVLREEGSTEKYKVRKYRKLQYVVNAAVWSRHEASYYANKLRMRAVSPKGTDLQKEFVCAVMSNQLQAIPLEKLTPLPKAVVSHNELRRIQRELNAALRRAKRLAPKKTEALGIDESKIILTSAEKACDLFALAGYRLIRINNLAEKA